MDIIDNLLEIKNHIEASRPKETVDIIMVSRAPFAPARGGMYRFEYQKQWYAVANHDDFHEIKRTLLEIKAPAMLTSPPLLGIPVIEDDELLARMLAEVIVACLELYGGGLLGRNQNGS